MEIEEIHDSLVNGQRHQMTDQIDEYGLYDFFEDYSTFLFGLYAETKNQYSYFKDAVVSYHRIKAR